MSRKILFTFLLLFIPLLSFSSDDETCLDCHSDPTLTMEVDGKVVSMFVRQETYANSVHGENGCVFEEKAVMPIDSRDKR